MATSQSVMLHNIRGRMAAQGVTQATIATALGKSQQAISLKLNGHRPLTTSEVLAIAEVLDVEAGDLFSEKASA